MSGKDYRWAFRKVRQLEGLVPSREVPKLVHKDVEITDPSEISKTFNESFTTRFTENDDLEAIDLSTALPDNESCTPFTLLELRQQLKHVKDKKAPGPDGIWNTMIKNAPEEFQREILRLVNLSWSTGVVPKLWKRGEIIPFLKPGKKKSEVESYRPITLTSALCKVMEKMLTDRMNHILRDRLEVRQSAFRKGRSALENLCQVTDSLLQARKEGKEAILLTFDLQKAFDAVQHRTLLHRMRKLGVPKRYLRWVQHYLKSRRVSTKVNGVRSKYEKIKTGVPQGSVLGPQLFSIYINGLINRLRHYEPTVFADDIGIVISAKTIEELEKKANRAVRIVQEWAEESDVEVNTAPGKTEYIHVRVSKEPKPTVVFPHKAKSHIILAKKRCIPKWFRYTDDNRMQLGEGSIIRYRFVPNAELRQRGIPKRTGKHHTEASSDWEYRSDLRVVRNPASIMGPLNSAREDQVIPLEVITARKVHRAEVVRYLGVLYDEDLKFVQQAAKMQRTKSRGLGLLCKLARLGCRKRTLSCILVTVVLARSLFGAECCTWLLPKTGKNSIESIGRLLNRATRIVTGCLLTTSLKELYHEADLPPLNLQLKYNVSRAYELFRLSKHLPVYNLVKPSETDAPESQWGTRAWQLIKDLPGIDAYRNRGYEELRPKMDEFPPWTDTRAITFNITNDKDQAIAEEGQIPDDDLRIYTDGSINYKASDFLTEAGAGVVLTCRGVTEKFGYNIRLAASSYRTEQLAILAALNKVVFLLKRNNDRVTKRVHLLTDSMSTLSALEQGPGSQKNSTNATIWKVAGIIEKYGVSLVMRYVPAHMDVTMNDAADEVAKISATGEKRFALVELPPRMDFGTMMTYHRRQRKRLWLQNAERREPFVDELNRQQEVLLSRFRTGHCRVLRFKYSVHQNEDCIFCGDGRADDGHILTECEDMSVSHLREKYLGCDSKYMMKETWYEPDNQQRLHCLVDALDTIAAQKGRPEYPGGKQTDTPVQP
eukprot:TRINITY_DN1994_c0_g1_i11.p1 TRINITY_DN1994_c0_g1~~TRINITY_DN1994_c0_g1_i11.p1  ORF type:complete len:996 (+),score=78.70 TRINITY_DN1994_c0_g1_i11:2407-5394(+)